MSKRYFSPSVNRFLLKNIVSRKVISMEVLCFILKRSNKVHHLTAINQGTWHKLLLLLLLLLLIIMIITIYYFRLSTYHSRLSTLAESRRRKNLHFSVIFRLRVMARPREATVIEPKTSRSAVGALPTELITLRLKTRAKLWRKCKGFNSYSWTFWGLILKPIAYCWCCCIRNDSFTFIHRLF